MLSAGLVPSSPVSETGSVSISDYVSIIAAKRLGDNKCRFSLVYSEDPKLGHIPSWLDSYLASKVIPNFIDGLVRSCMSSDTQAV